MAALLADQPGGQSSWALPWDTGTWIGEDLGLRPRPRELAERFVRRRLSIDRSVNQAVIDILASTGSPAPWPDPRVAAESSPAWTGWC